MKFSENFIATPIRPWENEPQSSLLRRACTLWKIRVRWQRFASGRPLRLRRALLASECADLDSPLRLRNTGEMLFQGCAGVVHHLFITKQSASGVEPRFSLLCRTVVCPI